MSETIDSITINYEEDGKLVTKELRKEVLTRGAWTTIMFEYQELDRNSEEYGPVKYAIRRYQKRNGVFMMRSKFNISNKEQAQKVVDILSKWIVEES